MIDWEQFVIVLPLWLPDALAVAAAVGLLFARGGRASQGWAWIVLPALAIAGSSFGRFIPIYFEPAMAFFNGANGPLVLWTCNALFRTVAFAALLYGMFRVHPAAESPTILDARSRQAAATAALLAVLLIQDSGPTHSNPPT